MSYIEQAEAFLNFHNKGGSDFERDFRFWADGKDFSRDDEAMIRREIVRLMSQDVFTDLNAWFDTPQPDNEAA